jgi:hypothetical protein
MTQPNEERRQEWARLCFFLDTCRRDRGLDPLPTVCRLLDILHEQVIALERGGEREALEMGNDNQRDGRSVREQIDQQAYARGVRDERERITEIVEQHRAKYRPDTAALAAISMLLYDLRAEGKP